MAQLKRRDRVALCKSASGGTVSLASRLRKQVLESRSSAMSSPVQSIGIWGLREEARKSWNHARCDEIVYISQAREGNFEVSHVLAKEYLRGNAWLDIRWTQAKSCKTRDGHYNAILEVVDNSLHPTEESDIPLATINGDHSMFVDVPESFELPQGMRAKGVQSILRLKRVENVPDRRIEHPPFFDIGSLFIANRKVNQPLPSVVLGNCGGIKMDKSPRQLIQGRAKAVDEIPGEQGNVFGDSTRLDYEGVPRSIKVIFFPDRIRAIFDPPADLGLKSIEVNLRPSGFHVNMFQ